MAWSNLKIEITFQSLMEINNNIDVQFIFNISQIQKLLSEVIYCVTDSYSLQDYTNCSHQADIAETLLC